MPKFLQDILTGKDGVSHDVGRHSWIVTTLAIIGVGIWHGIQTGAVDIEKFAQAIALNVTAHGAAIWGKRSTEPDPPEGAK